MNSITAETDIETLDLESRLKEKIYPLPVQFEKIQDVLDSLNEQNEDETHSDEGADERASFENRYYSICGRIKTLIKRGRLLPQIVHPSLTHQLVLKV